jgi:succinate---hydroxymethylglutarate CoA-transferase
VFLKNTKDDWCKIFEGKNILYGPIWGTHELINSDLIKDHNIVVDVEHPKLGKFPPIETPVHYS